MSNNVSFLLGLCACVVFVSACATGQGKVSTVVPTSEAQVATVVELAPVSSFADWQAQFRQRALSRGYASSTVDALLAQAQFDAQVVRLDRSQAEFSKMIWTYLDGAVSAERVATGQRLYRDNATLLRQLEGQYGVPAPYLLAIWGLESSYGGYMGNSNIISALSTLAYDGRRRQFAEEQLLALLNLANRGDVSLSAVEGSWAGGMGHTQFIPATFLDFGVDGNGDGRRNPWHKSDALASTANYLQHSGWQRGLSWGQEVRLPAEFDYQYVGQKRHIQQWQRLGLTAPAPLPSAQVVAELWLPGGYRGPAFLLYGNTKVIKVYNNSSSYALAVGLLADAIAGKPALKQAWPRQEQGLSRAEVLRLQTLLNQSGYASGKVDGILGRDTRAAFQRWQAATGQIADGFVSQRSAQPLLQP